VTRFPARTSLTRLPVRALPVRALPVQTLLARYAVAWLYLAGFIIAEVAYAGLPARDQSAVRRWASTNVVNLHHDPVGSLAASAFVPSSFAVAWPVLIALALFGANRALGNWRTAVVCVAGHVAGTLVSEGIVDYRVGHAVLYGSWPARVAAAVELAVLVIVGRIFGGLSNLDVAPVGHATALAVAVLVSSLLAGQLRRGRRPDPAERPAVPGTGA
jgi:hypothetical protein